MTPDLISVNTLAIALTLLHLVTIIHETSASGGSIGDYCTSYKDCQQEKLLICTPRSTCDCAFKSTFSAIQQKCVRHVGERCILPAIDSRMSGPLPDVGCVDNARCVHKQGSSTAFNHGICECQNGFYRTEESFCFKHPDNPSSAAHNGNSNTKYPSLSNVVNSIPNSDGKPSGHHHYSDSNAGSSAPTPYHHPLTRNSGTANHFSSQFTIISSLLIFISAIVFSS